jgi:hypothetical protein
VTAPLSYQEPFFPLGGTRNSITPLRLDLTDHDKLAEARKIEPGRN